MRRRAAIRHQHRVERLARLIETLWACHCEYHNVAAYRCYACGAGPPRDLCPRRSGAPSR